MKTKTRISKKKILTTTVKTTVAALVSAVMLETASAQAQSTNLLIDDFNESQQVDTNPNNAIPIRSQVGPVGDILGGINNGFRDMFITDVINTSGEPSNRSSLLSGSGEGFFSNDFGVTSTGIVRWDGANDTQQIDVDGLGGINIVEDNLDRIMMGLSVDLPGLGVAFNIYDVSGNMSSIDRTFDSSIPTTVEEDFLFSDFVGNANFTDVGAIELVLRGTPRMDVSINLVEFASPPPQTIPEPTSMLGLLVIGATGAGSILKRKHNR